MLILLLTFTSCNREESIEKEQTSSIERISKEMNADIKIDKSVTKDNAIIFNTEEELRQFITKVQDAEKNQKEIVIKMSNGNIANNKGCADGVYQGSTGYGGLGSITFDVTVTNGCISGISGGLSGWTLGMGYSQGGTSFGCTSGTVCGRMHYSLFYGEVGSIYSSNVCHNISISC